VTAPDAAVPELDGAPLFLLDDLPDDDEVLVGGAEGRHAVDVLRLAPGETVRVRLSPLSWVGPRKRVAQGSEPFYSGAARTMHI